MPEKIGTRIQDFLRDYLFPTVSLIVMVLVLVLITFPAINRIQESSTTISQKRREVENLESFITKLKDFSDRQSTIVADNLIVDQYLPKESSVSSFIDEVNALAVNSGLKTSELTGSETVQKEEELVVGEEVERPKRVLVTFNYTGTFDEVFRLFEEINNFKSLLSVQSVSFSSKLVDWSVEVTIASYNLPQEVLDQLVGNILQARGARRIETVDQTTLDLIKEKV